jgi:hypothetical protein
MSAVRICFVTCVTGGYDAVLKRPAKQTVPCNFVAFVDDLSTRAQANGWTLLDAQDYALGIDERDRHIDDRNSLVNNDHSFNRAKFIKLNLHRLPELSGYDLVVWLDGSIELTNPACAETCLRLADAGHPIVLFEHEFRQRLADEVQASHFDRYTSEFHFGQKQPYQDVDAQYADYVSEGFQDVGLWITCFIAFDMRNELCHQFLDLWYEQNLIHTTQDQIGFPYVCWKLNVKPYTLPDGTVHGKGHSRTDFYVKHGHVI